MLNLLTQQQKQALQEKHVVLLPSTRTLEPDYEKIEDFLRPARILSIEIWRDVEPTVMLELRTRQYRGKLSEMAVYAMGEVNADWQATLNAYLAELTQRAEAEDRHAMHALAQYYEETAPTNDPYGFDHAMQRAKHYYDLAMQAGHALASYCYAEKYRLILSPKQAPYFAENRVQNHQKYLMQSAEQGYVVAQYALGYMYSYAERGFAQDYEKCVYWYQKAAAQGYPEAMNNLGDKYEYGRGVVRNYAQAVYWYQRAADQKIVEAMYNLGRLYLRGLGIEQDTLLGREWLTAAADRGYQPARRKLKTLDQAVKSRQP